MTTWPFSMTTFLDTCLVFCMIPLMLLLYDMQALRYSPTSVFPHDSNSYCEELTYNDVLPSKEVATTELHPTYIGLLVVFRAFLLAKLHNISAEEHSHPYNVLSGLTRTDFIVFLRGYKEYSDISFPVIGVLPGKVLEVCRPHPMPPTMPSLPQQVLCPIPSSTGIFTGQDSQSTHLDVPSTYGDTDTMAKCTSLDSEELAPSDGETVLLPSPDTPSSLVLGIVGPTCSTIPDKCPPLDILELGPEVEEPPTPSKG